MNTQSKITLGDVWEEISKSVHPNRKKEKDDITCRFSKNKAGSIRMVFNIGMDICTLMEWKAGDKILLFRNKINGHLVKLSRSPDLHGYTLNTPASNPARMNVSSTLPFHKKYVLMYTKIVNFELDKNSILVDLSSLLQE